MANALAVAGFGEVGYIGAVDPEAKKMWVTAGSTGAVGIEIAVAIGIGYFGGRYLDQKLGTDPWLAWVGFGAGVGASIKALVRVVRTYQKSLQEEPPEKK